MALFNSTVTVAVLLILFLLPRSQIYGDEQNLNELLLDEDTDTCFDNGFNKDTLHCTYCDQLHNFRLSELRTNCIRCCNPLLTVPEKLTGLGSPLQKYAKAKLEVCWCKFPSMPQIEAFIKSDRPKNFPNLEVEHINFQNPIIKLMNEQGVIVETLSITKWTTDTIDEFLTTHLA